MPHPTLFIFAAVILVAWLRLPLQPAEPKLEKPKAPKPELQLRWLVINVDGQTFPIPLPIPGTNVSIEVK